MNLSAGYPYDLIRNGLPYDYPKLQKSRKTDVLILGGGISGALVAYCLQRAGIDCMLIDARSIGLGSTCASTSLLQYEIDVPLHKLSGMIGARDAELAYKLCGNAIHALRRIAKHIGFKDLQLCESVYFAADEKDMGFLQTEFAARKKAGFAVHMADADTLKKKYGLIAPGAIVSALGGYTNSYTFTHALHQYNKKQGVHIYDRTLATSIDHHQGGVTVSTAEGYQVKCRKLVYATGYEAVKYTQKNIVQLSATYATVSEQLGEKEHKNFEKAVFWNTADPYLYMRGTTDRRIIVGGRDVDTRSPEKRDSQIARKSGLLQRDFQRCFPEVLFKKEFSWTGTFGSTRDGLPYVGNDPALANGYFALGFGGNGITFSLLAAEMLRDLFLGINNKDFSIFSFNRAA